MTLVFIGLKVIQEAASRRWRLYSVVVRRCVVPEPSRFARMVAGALEDARQDV